MKKILFLLLVSFTLIGCKSIEHRIPPSNEFVILDPEKVPAIVMADVEWQVWDKNRIIEEASKTTNSNDVFYVLESDQVEKLFTNLIKISDTFSKSREVNHYYNKSINEYRDSLEKEEEDRK